MKKELRVESRESRESVEDVATAISIKKETLTPQLSTLATSSYTGHRRRLRERFIQGGAQALADYELLEMLLFAATSRADTKPMAKKLLAHFGDFAKVVNATPSELAKVKGVGNAAIASIKIVKAAAEKMLKTEASQGKIIQSWTVLLDY